ncbi:Caffeoyl-CoA O-methyltransferase [Bienertia sinuspersici]
MFQTNVACRVEQYLAIVRSFSAKKKSIVRRMGFEALLDFDVNKLNRRFYGAQTVIVKPNQVSWVLGVPMDGRVVPKDSKQLNDAGKALVERMKEKFSFNKEIPNQPVVDELLRDDVSEEDFKRAFLLFILSNLLCPTQSTGISPDLLPPATVALACAHYAWAPFIYDWLCKCGRRFHKDMEKVAPPRCWRVCPCLMILYLDRKPLPVSVNFYRAPRILAWCDNAVEAAIEADTVEWDTYGKALPVEGVFYGHPHPSEGFDMPWGSQLEFSGPPSVP